MADPIQGYLPFSSGASSLDFTGSPAGLSNSYASAYNSSLGMNQKNYENILAGYQQTAAQQQAQQQGVQSGYGQLSGAVLGGIQGIGAARGQEIADQYTKMSGDAAQGLISRGLGNTTIANSVQRGIGLDQSKAQNNLANQIAGLGAGYQSQLGLAGLGYAGQAAAQNTDQANRQLGFMNSVSAGYPDASLYARLAQMYGAGQVGAADRAQQQDALQRLQSGGGVVQRGTTSYSPGGSALTGRPTPGSFGAAGGSGSSLGGGGYTPGMAGNYFGLGTPTAVDAYGADASQAAIDQAMGVAGAFGGYGAGGGGLAGSLAEAQQQVSGMGDYYGYGLGGATPPAAGYEDVEVY